MNGPHADEELPLFPADTSTQTGTLTAKEAAQQAGVHPRTIHKWLKARKIRRTPAGIDPASLARYIERRRLARLPVTHKPHAEIPEAQNPQVVSLLQRVTELEREVQDVLRQMTTLRREMGTTQQLVADLLAALKARPGQLSPLLFQRFTAKPGTMRERILQYLQQAPRPKRAWQVQQALHLDKPPHRELSRLAEQGVVMRVGSGLYTTLGPPGAAEAEEPFLSLAPPGAAEAEESLPPLIELVWQTVQQANQPLRAAEVRARMQMYRSVHQELSKLVRRGRLLRKDIGKGIGVYSALDVPKKPVKVTRKEE